MGTGSLGIGNEHWRIGVLPGTGASLAFGQVRLPGRARPAGGADADWYDLLRPTPTAALDDPTRCASYVLLPFSNRVRDGVLRFGGRSWQLRPNGGDGNAMHGTAHEYAWEVAEKSADAVTLWLSSTCLVGANFPWAFDARVTYALDGPRLTVRTELTNADDDEFPAGFGHHPFFRRGLVDPARSEVRLRLPFDQAWPLRGALPTGSPGPLPPSADYRKLRPLERRPFVDACLTGRRGDEPVRLEWPASGAAISMRADEVFSHTVLYVPRRAGHFAVEPVTNANDGFNLLADGVPGHGVLVLAPGETRTGEFHLDLEV